MMKYKLNGDYLQVWTDDRGICVSLGTADKLVKALNNDDQTKKLRDKLTILSKGERG
jgi:hypothetical protein